MSVVDHSTRLGSPRDQGNRATCVAFAASGAHELARIERRGHPHELLATEALYWLCKQVDGETESGTYVQSAATVLAGDGQPPENRWPYGDQVDETSHNYLPPAGALDVAHMRRARVTQIDRSVASLRAVLDEGLAVVVVMDLWPRFFDNVNGLLETPDAGDLLGAIHAMAIVGYDDVQEVVLLRNSWGPTWGQGGMAWLPDAAWGVARAEAYRVDDDIDPT